MKRLTVLKVAATIHLIISLVWSIIYFQEMNDGKGWGFLISLGLISIGLVGLFLSWLIGTLVKYYVKSEPKKVQNIAESVFLIVFLLIVALRYSF